jgi:hypothetical protein
MRSEWKKKCLVISVVLLLFTPAMGADWSFYGSARMSTFWDHVDGGDFNITGNQGEDDDLIWDFQGNSRLGANVKADKVSGRVELAMRSENTHDGVVRTRKLFGVWKFAENMSLMVGKDYGLFTQEFSNSVFDADNDLQGIGAGYDFRPGQIRLQIDGLELAALEPNTPGLGTGGDVDQFMPRLEAAYTMRFDTFKFKLFGGFQAYKIEDNGAGTNTDDIDVLSWLLGGEGTVNLGAFYISAGLNVGENWSSANWNNLGYTNNNNAGAVLNAAGDDVEDCFSWQAALVAGFKLSDTLKFEVGGGYRADDQDAAENEDEAWQVYAQAVITLAPGVYLVPEIGYFDYMDNPNGDDEGYEWYAGAKWQINF